MSLEVCLRCKRCLRCKGVSLQPCKDRGVCVEVSKQVLRDGFLVAWTADVPDFFYRLMLPEALSAHFTLKGLTAQELGEFLNIEVPAGACYVALTVVPMGWNWAPFLRAAIA